MKKNNKQTRFYRDSNSDKSDLQTQFTEVRNPVKLDLQTRFLRGSNSGKSDLQIHLHTDGIIEFQDSYSVCYQIPNMNYKFETEELQKEIQNRYITLLNELEPGTKVDLFIINRLVKSYKKILFQHKNDEYDGIRSAKNKYLETAIKDKVPSSAREIYFMFTFSKSDFPIDNIEQYRMKQQNKNLSLIENILYSITKETTQRLSYQESLETILLLTLHIC